MKEYPCTYCEQTIKVSADRERKAARTAQARGKPCRFFCSKERRTQWRREQNLAVYRADSSEFTRMVAVGVLKKFGGDHVEAAVACGLHRHHLRAIMRGERVGFPSDKTLARLSTGLGIPLAKLKVVVPKKFEERRKENAIQNLQAIRAMGERAKVKRRRTRASKSYPNVSAAKREYWERIKADPKLYETKLSEIASALERGQRPTPTDRIKRHGISWSAAIVPILQKRM